MEYTTHFRQQYKVVLLVKCFPFRGGFLFFILIFFSFFFPFWGEKKRKKKGIRNNALCPLIRWNLIRGFHPFSLTFSGELGFINTVHPFLRGRASKDYNSQQQWTDAFSSERKSVLDFNQGETSSSDLVWRKMPCWFYIWDFRLGLFPFHSPLLRESLLFSFPPLTKMLQFSGLSYLIWVPFNIYKNIIYINIIFFIKKRREKEMIYIYNKKIK